MNATGTKGCIKAVLVLKHFVLVQYAGRSSKIGCNINLDPTITTTIATTTTTTTSNSSYTRNSLHFMLSPFRKHIHDSTPAV